jgi:hypothetical protein
MKRAFICYGYGSFAATTIAIQWTSYAVAPRNAVIRLPSTTLRTGFGRAEANAYFHCFGGAAAKTMEKDSHFLAAAGETRP